MEPISTIRPLAALLQQVDQVQEILELARQKVEVATSQHALGNGVPMFHGLNEALTAIGMAAIIAAGVAVGGYLLHSWMKHRRVMGNNPRTA